MILFDIEKILKDEKSHRICEIHLNENCLPYVGYLVGNCVHSLTPLNKYKVLEHTTLLGIINKLEKLYNINLDKDLSLVQANGLKFIVVKGNLTTGISITLRKSLKKNIWL